MAKKKKAQQAPTAVKEKQPAENFAEPFAALAALKQKLPAPQLAQAQRQEKMKKEAVKQKEPTAPPPPPPDDLIFRQEMADVVPIAQSKKLAKNIPPPKAWKTPELPNEDLEALRTLSELVSGRGDFDLTYTDEYVEGQIKGLAPALMEQLRQGRIPFQDHLDLHGLTVMQAEASVTSFILKSVSLGRGCVLLIHGRGMGSKDGVPVLKRYLEHFLLKGPVRKYILAFTTARPIDGGLGASYILLKR